jgi:hypothetical protein
MLMDVIMLVVMFMIVFMIMVVSMIVLCGRRLRLLLRNLCRFVGFRHCLAYFFNLSPIQSMPSACARKISRAALPLYEACSRRVKLLRSPENALPP